MTIDITELMRKIITLDDLKRFPEIEERLDFIGEGYIFQDNQPTHVIMTYEKYQNLMEQLQNVKESPTQPEKDVLYEGNNEERGEINTDALDILLNKIGKQTFVDYYYVFKADQNPEEVLQNECHFTLNSCRSRSSSARSIFGQELHLKALERIASSGRLDIAVTKKAQDILDRETGQSPVSVVSMETVVDEDAGYEVKIGKMVKGMLTTLLRSNAISVNEINDMLTEQYSKSTFNLNFTVLKEVLPGQKKDDLKKDSKGYNRYYDSTVMSYGREFLICSQWVDVLHKDKVEKWVIYKMLSIMEASVELMPGGTEYCVRDVLAKYWPYIGYTVRQRIGKKYYLMNKDRRDIAVGSKKNNCQYYKKL